MLTSISLVSRLARWDKPTSPMRLEVQLTAHEARLLGVLIEKAFTTPDQCPLTLNAVVSGANQKTNRNPVMSLSEEETLAALDGLAAKHLARRVFPENSRVEKYSHRGGEMLVLPAESIAVLAELLLRGPQTVGELRSRASRMVRLDSLEAVAGALEAAIERGYAIRLSPAPGSRTERYGQLLCPEVEQPGAVETPPAAAELAARVGSLEAEVERLRRQVEGLAVRLGQPLDD